MENTDANEAIWGLKDYAIWVPMSDEFYKNLPFYKITLEQFEAGDYLAQPVYKDSRTYLTPALKHFTNNFGAVEILDVGGYIGRFTIETCLACRELALAPNITCFEPGLTKDMIERNLKLNGFEDRAQVLPFSASAKEQTQTFAIPNKARISGRVIPPASAKEEQYENGWTVLEVTSTVLSKHLTPGTPFICKIDTEGHEVSVIEGMGLDALDSSPHILIMEFWPQVLKQKLFGTTFEEFLFERYDIYNIQSSLYPRGYENLTNLEEIIQKINQHEVNNIDLLLVSKNSPQNKDLINDILSAVGE